MAGGSFGWLAGTARRLVVLISTVATVATVVGFFVSESHVWAWLAIAALASLAVALAWTAHDEHNAKLQVQSSSALDPERQRRDVLRALVSAAIIRGLHAAQPSNARSYDFYGTWCTTTWHLLNAALGPDVVAEYTEALHAPGVHAGTWQDEIACGVKYLKDLEPRLDSIPLMGDWVP